MPVTPPKTSGRTEVHGEFITWSELKKRYLKLEKEYDEMVSKHRCVMCGERKNERYFFQQRNRKYADKLTHICKDCLYDIIYRKDKNGDRHDPTMQSLIEGLSYINKPFYKKLYEECCFEASKTQGASDFPKSYIKKIMTPSYDGKTFADSDFAANIETIIMDESEIDNQERYQLFQNRNDVIGIVGYDPFEKEDPADKPFLYSQLLSLIDTEDESEKDVYKILSCISITRDFLKIQKYDNIISQMMNDPMALTQNSSYLKSINELSMIKKNVQDSINKTAGENALTEKGSKTSTKGDKTFTGKLKQMKDLNLRSSKPNGFDLKTCLGMRQVLDISHASLCDQLFSKLPDNEWKEMIMEQRKMLIEKDQSLQLQEELARILLQENLDLKALLKENNISFMADSTKIVDMIEQIKGLEENVT